MSAYASTGSFKFLPPSSLEPRKAAQSTCDERKQIHISDEDVNDNAVQNSTSNPSKNESWYYKNDLLISIKSASIDPIRMIQYIGACRKRYSRQQRGISSEQTGERSGFRDRIVNLSNSLTSSITTPSDNDENWGEYDDTPLASPEIRLRSSYFAPGRHQEEGSSNECKSQQFDDTKDREQPLRCLSSVDKVDADINIHDEDLVTRLPPIKLKKRSLANNQNDALQFNICVVVNGRKYTAKRALPSFIKLRNDLLKEVSKCKEKVKKERRWNESNDSEIINSYSNNDVNGSLLHIPDLPFGNKSSSGVLNDIEGRARTAFGFAGGGFKRLQAALCSYCPEMEKWLRAVANIFPTSPSLANFLWEPLERDSVKKGNIGKMAGKELPLRNINLKRRSTSLHSIIESVSDESS